MYSLVPLGNWIAINAVQQSNPNKKMKERNMTTSHLRKSIGRSPLRLGFLVIPLALGCFALSPTARAVSPPPDGGYPNQNTAEGDDALASLTTGSSNTAIGWRALSHLTTGSFNTAVGQRALWLNVTGDGNTAVGEFALPSCLASANTAIGFSTLDALTTGTANTATGEHSLDTAP